MKNVISKIKIEWYYFKYVIKFKQKYKNKLDLVRHRFPTPETNEEINIIPINKAVCSQEGISTFYIDNSKQNWESNSSFLKNSWSGKESTKSIKVECTRLDEYIKDIQKIDMLKIDTEGSEYEILNSHKNILNKVKNISVEYHPVKNSKIEKILIVLREYFDIKIFFEGEEIKNMVNDKLLTIKGEKRV